MKAFDLFTPVEIDRYENWILYEKKKASESLEKAIEEGNICNEYAAEARIDELNMAWSVLQAYKGCL